MKGFLIALLLCSTSLFAGTLRLLNDSPYILRAVVRGNDGSYLGEMTVNPSQSISWEGGYFAHDNPYPGQSQSSLTPYSVIWYCMDGGNYGINTGMPTGATVAAQSSEGARSCNPSKKKQEEGAYPNKPREYQHNVGPPGGGQYGPPGSP